MEEKCPNCPECGKNLETYCRGKDARIYKCQHCFDETEPKLYWRETLKINAVRQLTAGPLIDLSIRQKSLLD